MNLLHFYRGPQPQIRALDHLKMIANVGLTAVRWDEYCNTRRKPKGNNVIFKTGDTYIARDV